MSSRLPLLATLLLCAMALSARAQENILPDPSFERDGVAGIARTGERSGHLVVGAKTHWGGIRGELAVEPFATYRATGWVKANVNSTGMFALYVYSWNSFDWKWATEVPLKTIDEWVQVETTFVTADDKVWLHPLAYLDAENSEAWIDDVEVVRVKSPRETMAALSAKANPSPTDRQLLARYFAHIGQRSRAVSLMEGADAYTKADIACMLGLSTDDESERMAWTLQMVGNGGLEYHNGDTRFAELTEGIDRSRLFGAVVQSLKGKPDSVAMARTYRILAEQFLADMDPLDTAAERRARLNAVAASLSHVREAVPSGTEARKEVEKLMPAFEQAQREAAQRKASLGNCRIVIGGKALSAKTHAIVVPAQPTPQEAHAARDLRYHLELLTGEVFDLRSDADPGDATPIVVGRSKLVGKLGVGVDYRALGVEGINIETAGPALVLTGNKRGVLYAVYTFLEDYCGCRWFTPDCTYVPKTGTFNIGRIERAYVPPLEYRATDYPNSRDADWAVRNKINGTQTNLDEKRGGKIAYSHFVHTFNALIPPDQYFDEHPEFFSEINGKRVKDHTQLCLTNPKVLELAIRRVREWIEAAPDATIFSVSQNDWHNFCQCPTCTGLAEHEGSQAGPIIQFVNNIAEAIHDDYPDKLISTLAYQYSRKPPKYLKPHPNVCVRLCSIECCFAHPLESDPYNATFVDDIREWAKICNRLYIWDYVINYAHCVMPFPNLYVLKPNINFFVNNSVTGIYEEANYFSKGGELAELRTYLMAKTLWDPTYDTNKALNEFLNGYYGPAAKSIRQYIDLIHSPNRDRERHIRIYSGPKAGNLPPELLVRASTLFDQAERSVADDPVLLHRVEVARLPLIYTQVEVGKGTYRAEGNQLVVSSPGGQDLPSLIDRFEQVARKEGVSKISERRNGTLNQWLADSRRGLRNLPVVTLRNESLEVAVLPAFGGRLYQMRYLKGVIENARYVPGSVDLMKTYGEPEALDPARGGYEEYSESEYRSPGWSEAYEVVAQDDTSLRLKSALGNGLELARVFELHESEPVVRITSSLTNTGNATRTARLRVHPAFVVDSIAQASALMKGDDGGVTRRSLHVPDDPLGEHEQWLREGQLPAGEWAVVNEEKRLAIVNKFDPEQIEICYLNWNGAEKRVNLELWSKEVELAPGQALTVSHGYEIRSVGKTLDLRKLFRGIKFW